jgi:D-alanyl-D-alanine carboxypeptidase
MAAGARGDAQTAAMKDEELVYAWNQQIDQLLRDGKTEEAATLTKRRDNLKARSGMARNKDSKPLQLFNSLYKQRMGDSFNDPDYFVDPITKETIPWDDFYNMWLNQYEVLVIDNGEVRKVPGYRKQRMDDPTETHAQATSQQQTMPGQMTRAQKVEVAQQQFRDRAASGQFTVEELIEGMLKAGYTMDDIPEEYK